LRSDKRETLVCALAASEAKVEVSMALSISPPYPPMEASLVHTIPTGEGWQYEPKWKGCRCLAFKDERKIELQSKSGKSLSGYFPELVSALQEIKSRNFVLDGEIVIAKDESFSFDDLLRRIDAAASVQKLAQEHPAKMIVFDLLLFADWELFASQPLKERRRLLEIFCAQYLSQDSSFQLSPATRQVDIARRWLEMADNRTNGIIAKSLALTYQSGKRTGMRKIKRPRAADHLQH
jgi:ATP-dependent DNA ligase